MAITIITQPDALTPAYNDIDWVIDSTNKNEPNFKYIIDIYDVASVPTLLKRYRVNPEPINKYGKVNLSQFLQSQVDFNLTQLYTNGASTASRSQFPYTLKFGEEYTTTWTYDGVLSNNTLLNTFDGYVRLSSSTTNHTYNIGDYIRIQQADGGTLYPILEGIFVIVEIPNTQNIVINLLYNLLSNTTPLPTVINGDTSKIGSINQFPDLLTASGFCVFNGVYSIPNYLTFNDTDYRTNAASTAKRFLTSRPNDFAMYRNQELYTMFNFYHSAANSIVSKVRYSNSNGDVIDSASISVGQGATLKPWLRLFKNGPGNHNGTSAVTGTLPLIKPDTEWYEYWLVDSSNNQLTQKQRINLLDECQINKTELLFLDRLGSWSSFMFNLIQYENITSNKQTFNKSLDYDLTGAVQTPYLYGGDVTYNSTMNRTYTLNSSWLTEDDNRYMEELITSPMVLMRFTNGQEYVPVNILTNTFELNKERNTKLIRKEITVKTAWNEKINI